MNQTNQIPDYAQALTALENGDNIILEKATFPFEIDDGYYIEQVRKAVHALLDRPGITPSQDTSIKRVLHGLGRLPLRTPGLQVQISLVDIVNDEAIFYDLCLSSDRFATESGGYGNFGFGTDSFSGEAFEIEPGIRNYTGFDITSDTWPIIFSEMLAAELQIEDDSDDSMLDWDHPDGSEFWEWLASQT